MSVPLPAEGATDNASDQEEVCAEYAAAATFRDCFVCFLFSLPSLRCRGVARILFYFYLFLVSSLSRCL